MTPPQPRETLSLRDARRIAIAAQGFRNSRSEAIAGKARLRALAETLGVLQIDSVNVIARAHTLPGFSRLGAYETAHLDALAYGGRRRSLFEYWGHEASYLPVELYPLMRWRMERASRGVGIYSGLAKFGRERRPLIDEVLAEVRARGPISAAELSIEHKGEGGWWGWSDGKRAIEWLFWAGEVTTATRRGAFERVYDITERVLPKPALDAPVPDVKEAQRELLRRSARALGIGSARCLRDYYRLEASEAPALIAGLVEEGTLVPVAVEGWKQAVYLHRDAHVPARVTARALLAPFDPLVWQRERVEALFGSRIRLEIYTPAEKRVHGYYVLPFLLGDRLAARVDLKADRGSSRLVVRAAHLEPGSRADRTASALADELRLMARWLRLGSVVVEPVGDLAKALADAIGHHAGAKIHSN